MRAKALLAVSSLALLALVALLVESRLQPVHSSCSAEPISWERRRCYGREFQKLLPPSPERRDFERIARMCAREAYECAESLGSALAFYNYREEAARQVCGMLSPLGRAYCLSSWGAGR